MSLNKILYIQNNERYDLYAVINHIGDTINSGHYTGKIFTYKLSIYFILHDYHFKKALCKSFTDFKWRLYNDSVVQEVDIHTYFNLENLKSAYVLFYKKRANVSYLHNQPFNLANPTNPNPSDNSISTGAVRKRKSRLNVQNAQIERERNCTNYSNRLKDRNFRKNETLRKQMRHETNRSNQDINETEKQRKRQVYKQF